VESFPSFPTEKVQIIKKYNFHFILCGYETWFRTLREDSRFGVFENRALRKTFGY
jgi:hypothetical protein